MEDPAPILYVDDEELSLTLFRVVFEDDYRVYTAESAREAIEILRREPIQVLVTDQCMPEMTGVELLQEIRDEFPDIGRMILTAYLDIETIFQAVNTGRLDRFLTKPWKDEELKAAIEEVLRQYQRRLRPRRIIDELERELERERRLRRTFQEYVPASVVDELVAAGDLEPPSG